MANSKRVFIDGAKLEQAIFDKGMALPEASMAMGRSNATLTQWVREGEMYADAVNVIEAVLGISPDEYVTNEPKPRSRSKRYSGVIPIDGEKLEALVRKLNIQMRSFGTSIKAGESTPYHWFRGNYIPRKYIKVIEEVWGIKYEDYELKEDKTENAGDKFEDGLTMKKELTKDELYQIIYGACYAAVKEVLGGRKI